MTSARSGQLRYTMFVLLVGIFIYRFEPGLDARGSFGWCDNSDTCGPEVSCDDPCWVAGEGQLPFQNTCGGYGGQPVDVVRGNCLGTCGDGYCNDANFEDYDTCPEDCLGYCGDDMCLPPERDGSCEDDCGPHVTGPGCSECTPGGSGCGPGYTCNTQSCCVVATCAYRPCNPLNPCCEGFKCYAQFNPWEGECFATPPPSPAPRTPGL